MQKSYLTKNLTNDRETTRGTRWTLTVDNTTHVFMGTKSDAVEYFSNRFNVQEPKPKKRTKTKVKTTDLKVSKTETK